MFEEVYQYFSQPEAWRVAPGAANALQRLRAAGVATAVVSNFDTRLRPLLRSLGLAHLFDAIIVSAGARLGYRRCKD
jgi:FMN phosphatase YigB (HAD superfamily)